MATKRPSLTYFNVGGNPARGVSAVADFNTDLIDMKDYNGPWLVYVERTLTDGDPRWTVQHSHDGVTWWDYDTDAENLPIPFDVRESVFFPNYIRIKYTANGATGFVTLIMDRTN